MTDYAEYCAVKSITGTTLTSAQLSPFMMAANVMIRNAVANGCTATLDVLIQAANFLTAHLLAQSKPGEDIAPVQSERFENWQVTRQTGSNGGTGINATSYGTMANMLLGGCLTGIDKPTATVDFL